MSEQKEFGEGVFKALSEQMVEAVATGKTQSEEITKLRADVARIGDDAKLANEKMAAEVALVQGVMKQSLGNVSSAKDWMNEAAKWMCGVWQARGGIERVDNALKFRDGSSVSEVMTKTAVQFSTVYNDPSGNTASYLLPELLRPGVVELSSVYGNLYAALEKITVPAGQKLYIPAESVSPVAAWRTSQTTSMTEEPTGATWSHPDITTELLYVLQKASNELMNNPSINFGAILLSRAIRAMMKKLEADFVAAASTPSAGLAPSATAQTAITSGITFAKVVTFIQECIADDPSSYDNSSRVLVMHPKDVMTLATASVGASELTGMLLWGDPRKGVPPTLLGFPILATPAAYATVSATAARRIILGDLKQCFLGEDAAMSVDYSEHVLFQSNATMLRFLNHYDWCFPVTSELHQASVAD